MSVVLWLCRDIISNYFHNPFLKNTLMIKQMRMSIIYFYLLKLQSWTEIVVQNRQISSLKMPYFLYLKDYERHISGFYKPANLLLHTNKCWRLMADEAHNFMFQHCPWLWFSSKVCLFFNNFVLDCINQGFFSSFQYIKILKIKTFKLKRKHI